MGATYPDLSDCWVITAEDEATYKTQLYIPAPLYAAAIADGVNYSPATSEWLAIEAALPALAVPFTGASIQQIDAATIARDIPHISQPWLNYTADITWARRTLIWYGVHGRPRLTHLTGDVASLGGDFDTVQAAFQAVSSAMVAFWWEDEMAVYLDPPTTDMYNSVNDACNIWFRDDAGNMTEITVPAPNRAIFLQDGKTLDVNQANVATFITSAIAELSVPVSGRPVVACVGGHLSKRSVY